MRGSIRLGALGAAALLAFAGVARAGPVDSDLGAAPVGGCYPTPLRPSLFDMLTLVNPEWAPVVNGPVIDSEPVLLHGTIDGMHGDTGGDFPATHVRSDVNQFVQLDPQDADRLGTGNDDGLIAFEWEAGALPDWAWGGVGDHIVGLGRWIFDCGHPAARGGHCSASTAEACVVDDDCRPPTCPTCSIAETCQGVHFGFSTELHPPYATAVIREGRGAVLVERQRAVPATRADVYVSADGGGSGDRCVLGHQASSILQLTAQCFPLTQPVAALHARDFEFDVPLPPRPRHGRLAIRQLRRPTPGGVAAAMRIEPVLDGPSPHLHARVVLTRASEAGGEGGSVSGGPLPTGLAATLWAGWRNDHERLTHVRVRLEAVVVRNALQRVRPLAPKACVPGGGACETAADCGAGGSCSGVGPIEAWQLQASVNGEWRELPGLDRVRTGETIPEEIVFDQYLPSDGSLHLRLDGAARECVTTMFGKSLATDLNELGLTTGLDCLNSTEHPVGVIDVQHPGPDFGAGREGARYEAVSVGGEGGVCSLSSTTACVVDDDCPGVDRCLQQGGAVALRYRIDRLRR